MKNPPKCVPEAFLGHVEELSIHSFGCRVLQKAVEHLPQAHKKELLEEMHKCAPRLLEDAFGSKSALTTFLSFIPTSGLRKLELIRRLCYSKYHYHRGRYRQR